MARIRTVKPEFWTSEQVMECSRDARLLFIGIWNFADDYGNHPASPKTIKALVLPGDDVDSTTVQGWIDELAENGLIAVYEAEGRRYLHVRGWRHQKIEKPSRKYPAFSEPEPDHEGDEGEPAPDQPRPKKAPASSAAFEAAWKGYPKRDGSNPKNKAESAWRARVKEGVSEEAMLAGVMRYHAYCAAKGSIGSAYVMQAQRFFGPGREYEAEWSAVGAVSTISRHVGLDKIDHTIGLTDRGDGTYDF